MATTTAPRAIRLTQIDLPSQTPGAPCPRHKIVLPVSRIDEVHESTIGDYVLGQFSPIAVNCSLIVKVNGERIYVEERNGAILDMLNGLT